MAGTRGGCWRRWRAIRICRKILYGAHEDMCAWHPGLKRLMMREVYQATTDACLRSIWEALVIKRAHQPDIHLDASYTGKSVCPASCADDAQLHETLKIPGASV